MVRLLYTPPYDWDAFLAFLRPRAIAGVEVIDADSYEREGVRVMHDAANNALAVSDASEAERVRKMFDVDADITAIEKHFARDSMLGPLVRKHRGIRVPGTWDPFEMAIRAIVGQQISVAGATTIMARIAARHGVTPQSLMRARTNPGMPQVRWNSIRGLARAVARGDVTFERGATLDESIGRLTAMPGIGPWTAHYIAMRALREPDAFPHGDLGLRKASGMISDRELLARAEAWRPYRSYDHAALAQPVAFRCVNLSPMLRYTYVDTPIGAILVAGDEKSVVEIHFAGAEPKPDWVHDDNALREVADQLRDYFAGKRKAFDLPLAPRGTEFQQSVWRALLDIPYGETTTYSTIAERIGRPAAVRAVGAANGANPIPIVIPCHRVIGASGSLTGFGGGLDVKRRLLALEARVAGRSLF